MVRATLLCFAVLATLTGCQSPLVCTAEARSSFVVTVQDAATGANLAPAATVLVREGGFQEYLVPTPGGTYSGVFERPGTYQVTVEHPDYATWSEDGVVVRDGRCHVDTRELTARLTRAS